MSTFNTSALATAGSGSAPTIAITPSAVGNLLVLIARINSSTATFTSVTDDRGGSWAAATTLRTSGNCTAQLWYAVSTSTSLTTITVNSSVSASNTQAVSSFVTTLTTLAQNASAAANNANPDSGPITTAATAILVCGVGVTPNADAFTAGSGWTERQPGAGGQRAYIADQIDVGAGTYNGQASISTEDWSAHIAAFVAATTQDTPELYGRPDGLRGSRQLHSLLAQ